MTKLPPATLRILMALWEQDNMRAHYDDLRHMSGVKGRAFYPFIRRMEALKYTTGGYEYISLTLNGMVALKEHFKTLYNERPCEAHLANFKKYEYLPTRSNAA